MKKKGLMISTVVMVMVLVAALSTATFAWFSSTAQAKVQNISINTSSSEGIVVGVKNSAGNYVSGDIGYDRAAAAGTKWTGSLDAMSQLVDFKTISNAENGLGNLKSATTRIGGVNAELIATAGVRIDVHSTDYIHANFAADTVYYILIAAATDVESIPTIAADQAIRLITTTDSALFGEDGKLLDTTGATFAEAKAVLQGLVGVSNVNKIGIYTKYAADTMLVPTTYHAITLKPIAYMTAITNFNFMDLPISVSPTSDIKGIMCSIKVTPNQGKAPSSLMPGMAAASRIWIVSADGKQKQALEPFTGWAENGGVMKKGATTWATATAAEKSFDYNFAVAYSSTDEFIVKQGEYFDLNFQIWIEGEDGQCVNRTAGSGFTVDISYSFTKNFADMTIAGDKITLNALEYAILTGISTSSTIKATL